MLLQLRDSHQGLLHVTVTAAGPGADRQSLRAGLGGNAAGMVSLRCAEADGKAHWVLTTSSAGKWMSHSAVKKAKTAAAAQPITTGLFSAFSNCGSTHAHAVVRLWACWPVCASWVSAAGKRQGCWLWLCSGGVEGGCASKPSQPSLPSC